MEVKYRNKQSPLIAMIQNGCQWAFIFLSKKCSSENGEVVEKLGVVPIFPHLMKKRSGATNKEIGELFGGISYSAVAKAYQRFEGQIEENDELREMVEKVEGNLSFVKG